MDGKVFQHKIIYLYIERKKRGGIRLFGNYVQESLVCLLWVGTEYINEEELFQADA